MPLISSTFSVSNLDTSREVNNLQYWNILDISLTLLVLNPETSICFKDVHPENILAILTTFEVSNFETSTFSKDVQSVKIYDISTTSLVDIEPKLTVVKEAHESKACVIFFKEVGWSDDKSKDVTVII